MTIRLLPQNLINQIAAGEVVERPASALKELIENAIDAGATKIDVVMVDGGKTYFSVTDNGKGMLPEELSLAVERHATSKLPDEDLFNINFLGFRGEALPSIASVAKLKITSRAKGSDTAWCLSVNGGIKGEVSPAAFGQGTQVEVKELFFATPARLKFLKAAQTEMGYAKDVINRLAMAYPHIAFSLSDDRRILLTYSKTNDLLTRVSAVIGKNFNENALQINTQHQDIKLTGFVGLPTYLRATSSEQYLFVNGRFIKDKMIMGAVRGAYQGLIGHGNEGYPVLSLFLQIPCSDVDVNVHPAKTEVRFKDAAAIRGLLVGAIRQVLTEHANKTSSTYGGLVLDKSMPSFLPNKQHDTSRNYVLTNSKSAGQSMMKMTDWYAVKTEEEYIDIQHPFTNPGSVYSYKEQEVSAPDYEDFPPLGFAKAQLHETYIIAQNRDSIVIVDQHAAHERLTYEKIQSTLGKKIKTQLLLVPQVVDLKSDEVALLISWQDKLAELGLVIDSFGYDSIAVREIPTLFDKVDMSILLQDLADTIKEFEDTVALKDKIKNICAKMACHGSIRSGRKLTLDEMNALLRQMENCGTSGQCIHGRPTYIELKLNDIERLFGRK